MGDKTDKNLAAAFAAESKASLRNDAFALMAKKENLPHIVKIFRALSNGESVHANKYLMLMRGRIGSTKENLSRALDNEIMASSEGYPRIIKEAEEEGDNSGALKAFSQSRDAEVSHKDLLERAINDPDSLKTSEYHVCQICGFISTDEIPENCPVCGAVKSRFKQIT
jgi:rubrerythrin